MSSDLMGLCGGFPMSSGLMGLCGGFPMSSGLMGLCGGFPMSTDFFSPSHNSALFENVIFRTITTLS
jgi:hypothetical protein